VVRRQSRAGGLERRLAGRGPCDLVRVDVRRRVLRRSVRVRVADPRCV
jgi:hypothetical protein